MPRECQGEPEEWGEEQVKKIGGQDGRWERVQGKLVQGREELEKANSFNCERRGWHTQLSKSEGRGERESKASAVARPPTPLSKNQIRGGEGGGERSRSSRDVKSRMTALC